jgi:hypothetical protein
MRARHRVKGTGWATLPARELVALIADGKREFDEIYVEPDSKPPLVLDGRPTTCTPRWSRSNTTPSHFATRSSSLTGAITSSATSLLPLRPEAA